MAKYQRYEEYKEAGVEWLDVIPNHWNTVSLKMLIDVRDGTHETPSYVEKTDNSYPLVTSKDVTSGQIDLTDCKHISQQDYESIIKRSAVSEGDILMPMIGTVGSPVLVEERLEIAIKNLALFRTSENNDKITAKFLHYFLNSKECSMQFSLEGRGGVQNFVSLGTLRSLGLPLISLEDQVQIANFLDFETAQIDTLIEKQQTLIQLLKEKRQAVIGHGVTKGLNPDAPMKDSGVEWLGEVPEHWEFIKFDYVINAVGDIDHYMPKSIDSGIPYVMTGDLRDLVSEIDFENCKQVAYSDYVKLSRKIKASKDDIIFARYATIGTLSYVDVDADFLVSYSCVTIKPNAERTSGRYLFRYLKSQAFLQAITMYINSNTQGNVGIDSLRNVKVIMPPLSEQEEIINFLNDEVMKIDQLLNKAKSAITLMQERRTALISAAVTGKIDVRGWVAPA